MDRAAFVWTRATGEPRRLGFLVLADDQVRFTYDRDAGDLPGLSVVHDVPRLIASGVTIPWRSTELNPLPPMFQALVPPRNPENLQRMLLLRLLERRGLPPELEIDWHMLLLAGRNGIGHLDVFPSDESAAEFYRGAREIPAIDLAGTKLFDLAFQAMQSTASPATLDEILAIVGVHPTAGGMMPKLLLPIVPPDANEAADARPVQALVKIQNRRYEGVLFLEDVGYEIHARAGLAVPRRWLVTSHDQVTVLATERFDRDGDRPIPLESLYCGLFVATAAGKEPVTTRWSMDGPSPAYELAARFMSNPALGSTVSPALDQKQLYQRILLGLLTGNGDLHLENFAFLGWRNAARLSPVFDPAPMRAYREHSMVSSVSFGGLAFADGAMPVELGPKLIALGSSFGLQKRHSLSLVGDMLDVTRDFPDLVNQTQAPDSVKHALLARVDGVRHRIEKAYLDQQGKAPNPRPHS